MYNQRNHQFQLSTNARLIENGVDHQTSSNTICPACHRSLEDDEVPRHAPRLIDTEYFRLLSSSTVQDPGKTVADVDELPRSSVSLPKSAFNQGYFEQYQPF